MLTLLKDILKNICFSSHTFRLLDFWLSYILLYCTFTLTPSFLLLAAGHFLCKRTPWLTDWLIDWLIDRLIDWLKSEDDKHITMNIMKKL